MNLFKSLSKIISKRKAIRNFSNRKISDNTINKILKVSLRAPSWYRLEPWYVIVIKDQDIKKKIYEKSSKQIPILESSHIFILMSYNGKYFNLNNKFFQENIKSLYKNKIKTTYDYFYNKI